MPETGEETNVPTPIVETEEEVYEEEYATIANLELAITELRARCDILEARCNELGERLTHVLYDSGNKPREVTPDGRHWWSRKIKF